MTKPCGPFGSPAQVNGPPSWAPELALATVSTINRAANVRICTWRGFVSAWSVRSARFTDVSAHTDRMPVRLHHIVVDAHDLPGLARFWTQALGWKVLSEREREIVIGTDENAPVGMCFMPVTGLKTVKSRLHLDLTSSAQDRDQEIERLIALGARRVDIGQTGAESWTVLADPEGNEFCVVRPKETLIG